MMIREILNRDPKEIGIVKGVKMALKMLHDYYAGAEAEARVSTNEAGSRKIGLEGVFQIETNEKTVSIAGICKRSG